MVSITIIVGVSLIQTFVMLICFIFMFVVIKLTNKKKKKLKRSKKKQQQTNAKDTTQFEKQISMMMDIYGVVHW
jgi:large-conductance mechanosensitive channel